MAGDTFHTHFATHALDQALDLGKVQAHGGPALRGVGAQAGELAKGRSPGLLREAGPLVLYQDAALVVVIRQEYGHHRTWRGALQGMAEKLVQGPAHLRRGCLYLQGDGIGEGQRDALLIPTSVQTLMLA